MITAPWLQLVQQAGEAVLVLCDGLDEAELLRSRLTRAEVRRQLLTLARSLDDLPAAVHGAMPEIDWPVWQRARRALEPSGLSAAAPAAGDELLWFAVQSLVPATLNWLRVYRSAEPALFEAWD